MPGENPDAHGVGFFAFLRNHISEIVPEHLPVHLRPKYIRLFEDQCRVWPVIFIAFVRYALLELVKGIPVENSRALSLATTQNVGYVAADVFEECDFQSELITRFGILAAKIWTVPMLDNAEVAPICAIVKL